MSRVPCLDCGIPVVVDPAGLCPEGHLVGRPGARIATAIGADAPHPDEPEPWVATVEVDAIDGLGTTPAAADRPILPLGAPVPEPASAPPTEAPDHEELLRELHALSDLGSAPADRTTPNGNPAPAPADDRTPPPAADDRTPPPAAVAEGLAEFSALETAVQAMEGDRPPVGPSASPTVSPSGVPVQEPTTLPDTAALTALFTAEVDRSPSAARATGNRHLRLARPVDESVPSADPAPSPQQASPAPSLPPPPAAGHDLGAGSGPTDTAPAPAPAPASAPANPPGPPRAADVPREAPSLDVTNFTARGTRVAGSRSGKRRLFGR